MHACICVWVCARPRVCTVKFLLLIASNINVTQSCVMVTDNLTAIILHDIGMLQLTEDSNLLHLEQRISVELVRLITKTSSANASDTISILKTKGESGKSKSLNLLLNGPHILLISF